MPPTLWRSTISIAGVSAGKRSQKAGDGRAFMTTILGKRTISSPAAPHYTRSTTGLGRKSRWVARSLLQRLCALQKFAGKNTKREPPRNELCGPFGRVSLASGRRRDPCCATEASLEKSPALATPAWAFDKEE